MFVVNSDGISDALLAAFERQGFLILRGAFGPAEMRRITRWVEELEALPEAPGKYMKYFEESRLEPGRRLLNRVENFVPYHPGLAEVVNGPALCDPVSRLFGEEAVLFKDKINFKLPGGGGFEAHQDIQAGWENYASRFVTAAVAIDATDRSNGCLELARWKHRHERIGPLWEPLTDEHLRDVVFEPLEMLPGDAAFFDGHLPHRSGPNQGPRARRVLYVTYNPAAEGDQRGRYYADKFRSYPPDRERDPVRDYRYRV